MPRAKATIFKFEDNDDILMENLRAYKAVLTNNPRTAPPTFTDYLKTQRSFMQRITGGNPEIIIDLSDRTISGAAGKLDLTRVNFGKAILRGTKFHNCDLSGATIQPYVEGSGAGLTFTDSNLTGAKMVGNISGVVFGDKSKLDRTDFTEARGIAQCTIAPGCDFQHPKLAHTDSASFKHKIAREKAWSRANAPAPAPQIAAAVIPKAAVKPTAVEFSGADIVRVGRDFGYKGWLGLKAIASGAARLAGRAYNAKVIVRAAPPTAASGNAGAAHMATEDRIVASNPQFTHRAPSNSCPLSQAQVEAWITENKTNPISLQAFAQRESNNPKAVPSLTDIKLTDRKDLANLDFSGAIIKDCHFRNCKFDGCKFNGVTADGFMFAGSNFNNVEMQNSKFTGANFVNCKFSGKGKLDNSELIDSKFNGAKMDGVDLSHSDLTGSLLTGASITNSKLVNTDLSRVTGTGATIKDTDISGANLSNAQLRGLTLDGVTAKDVIAHEADFSSTDSVKTKFTNTKFENLQASGLKAVRAEFTGLEIKDSKIPFSDFSGATFDGCTIEKTSMVKAVMSSATIQNATSVKDCDARGAKLDSASITRATFDKTDLSHADFTKATLDTVSMKNSNLSSANFSNPDNLLHGLTKVDFTGSDLSDANMNGARFTGGNLGCKLYGAHLSRAKFVDGTTTFAGAKVDRATTLTDADIQNGIGTKSVEVLDTTGLKLTKTLSQFKVESEQDKDIVSSSGIVQLGRAIFGRVQESLSHLGEGAESVGNSTKGKTSSRMGTALGVAAGVVVGAAIIAATAATAGAALPIVGGIVIGGCAIAGGAAGHVASSTSSGRRFFMVAATAASAVVAGPIGLLALPVLGITNMLSGKQNAWKHALGDVMIGVGKASTKIADSMGGLTYSDAQIVRANNAADLKEARTAKAAESKAGLDAIQLSQSAIIQQQALHKAANALDAPKVKRGAAIGTAVAVAPPAIAVVPPAVAVAPAHAVAPLAVADQAVPPPAAAAVRDPAAGGAAPAVAQPLAAPAPQGLIGRVFGFFRVGVDMPEPVPAPEAPPSPAPSAIDDPAPAPAPRGRSSSVSVPAAPAAASRPRATSAAASVAVAPQPAIAAPDLRPVPAPQAVPAPEAAQNPQNVAVRFITTLIPPVPEPIAKAAAAVRGWATGAGDAAPAAAQPPATKAAAAAPAPQGFRAKVLGFLGFGKHAPSPSPTPAASAIAKPAPEPRSRSNSGSSASSRDSDIFHDAQDPDAVSARSSRSNSIDTDAAVSAQPSPAPSRRESLASQHRPRSRAGSQAAAIEAERVEDPARPRSLTK